jgi:cyclopropane-fatty-acyl-phospholipid synthase
MADVTSRQVVRETTGYTERCAAILRRVFGGYGQIDFAVRLWDGSIPILPESGEPRFTLVVNHPAALRRMLLPPSEINLGEAFIFGDFDIEGDIFHATSLLDYFPQLDFTAGDLTWLVRNLLALPRDWQADTARPGLRPAGQAHSRRRDRETVQFHYDVSNDFYALWLDDLMVYSCAYFETGDEDIHTAQQQKLEHICRKLRLQPGERLLDIGCGWGGLLVYAAEHYGVDATGITLSANQVDYVERLIEERGLADHCRVRLVDYREVPEDNPFDKLVSVGMFEHVGRAKLLVYMEKARRLLKPGGLFLNHGIASMTGHYHEPGLIGRLILKPNSFMQRYVFPDGELVDISMSLEASEAAGFEVRDVESLREHYALTLRHWVRRLTERRAEALRYVDEPTFRVWRLYMAGSSYGFASSRINVYQALLSKSAAGGHSGLPWTRAHLYH